jgi:hypothetical protein
LLQPLMLRLLLRQYLTLLLMLMHDLIVDTIITTHKYRIYLLTKSGATHLLMWVVAMLR